MRPRVSPLRRLGFAVLVAIVLPACILSLAEIALRIFWTNPYLIEQVGSPYFRLHRPNISASVRAEELYPSGGEVRFSTGDDRAIQSGIREMDHAVVALGGSTTESALVPEGERWPDLLRPPAKNFGVSANTLIDSYFNLRYLTDECSFNIKKVYFMHAINDLRAFTILGASSYRVDDWRQPPVDLFSMDAPDAPLAFGLTSRDFALTSFLRFVRHELGGRRIFRAYLDNRRENESRPLLDQASFEKIVREFQEEFLPLRRDVFQLTASFAQARGIDVVVITQPHAFRADYTPFCVDLRLFPVVEGRRMSTDQAARLVAMLNSQNLDAASEFELRAVDAAAQFGSLDPSPLFYDSVHLTPRGCEAFVRIVNASSK